MTVNIEGKDIVACISIIVLGVDVALGMDGVLIPIIATVVGWYFGSKGTKT